MVLEVRLGLKLVTGTTVNNPLDAVESVKEMLNMCIKDTPLGTLEKDGLFGITLETVEIDCLSGELRGKTFVLKNGQLIEEDKS